MESSIVSQEFTVTGIHCYMLMRHLFRPQLKQKHCCSPVSVPQGGSTDIRASHSYCIFSLMSWNLQMLNLPTRESHWNNILQESSCQSSHHLTINNCHCNTMLDINTDTDRYTLQHKLPFEQPMHLWAKYIVLYYIMVVLLYMCWVCSTSVCLPRAYSWPRSSCLNYESRYSFQTVQLLGLLSSLCAQCISKIQSVCIVDVFPSAPQQNHEWLQLGLTSSQLWWGITRRAGDNSYSFVESNGVTCLFLYLIS